MDSFWSLMRYSVPPSPREHSDLSHFADTNFEVQYLLATFSRDNVSHRMARDLPLWAHPVPSLSWGKLTLDFQVRMTFFSQRSS